jgi:site-specific DNA-methyltransferase (adenine-specific)
MLNKITNIDVLDGLKQLENESADIVLIDPPYNIGKDFGNNNDKLALEEYTDWSKKWIDESLRILSPTGSMYVYGFSEILCYLFPLVVNANRRWLVWHYTNKNVPTTKFWQRSHESIILAWKTEKRIFNLDDVREEYTETFIKNAAGHKRAATPGRFSKSDTETTYNAHPGGALPRDVIKVPALAGGAGRRERFFYCKNCDKLFSLSQRKEHGEHVKIEHPTQKPMQLTEKLLKAAKPKDRNGLVVVPFAGTGSELLVAKQLEMSFIGFEINPNFCRMSNLLIENGLPQKGQLP